MPRRMSFAMTTRQMYAQEKTVTRREGWENARPGERIVWIEKGQGLKKGERQVVGGTIEVVNARREPLEVITPGDVIREGFPGYTTADFIETYLRAHRGKKCHELVTRIEFRHVRTP